MSEVLEFRNNTIRDLSKYRWNPTFHRTLWEYLKEADPGLPRWDYKQLHENGWSIQLPPSTNTADRGFIYLSHDATKVVKKYRLYVNNVAMPVPTVLIFGILLNESRIDPMYLKKYQYVDLFDTLQKRFTTADEKKLLVLRGDGLGFYSTARQDRYSLFYFKGLMDTSPRIPIYRGEKLFSGRQLALAMIGTGATGFYYNETALTNKGINPTDPPDWVRMK